MIRRGLGRGRRPGLFGSVAPAPAGAEAESGAESGADVIDQLQRLADLRDRGVLTDSEFQTQKARLQV